MTTILIISCNNSSSHIFVYKLAFVKIKIKKIVIKSLHFYFDICGLFFSIIVYIIVFYKYIKLVLPNLEYLFMAAAKILMAKTINVFAIICIYFSCQIFFVGCLPCIPVNRHFFTWVLTFLFLICFAAYIFMVYHFFSFILIWKIILFLVSSS